MRITSELNSENASEPTSALDLVVFAQSLQREISVPNAPVMAPPLASNKERAANTEAQCEQEQQSLNRLLWRFKRKSRQRKHCLRWLVLCGGFALVSGLLLLGDESLLGLLLLPFVAASAVALLLAGVGSLLHAQISMLVAHIPDSDARAIGPLLEALRLADMEGIPQRALMELLPNLTPADAVLFTDTNRHFLHLALDDANTDLVILLLQALEKIGDGRSIAAVRRLANGKGRARVDGQVLLAAQHCLPLLEARSVYDGENQTLLRASAMRRQSHGELLRSAAEQPDAANDELLHPLESGDENRSLILP